MKFLAEEKPLFSHFRNWRRHCQSSATVRARKNVLFSSRQHHQFGELRLLSPLHRNVSPSAKNLNINKIIIIAQIAGFESIASSLIGIIFHPRDHSIHLLRPYYTQTRNPTSRIQ